MDIFYSYAPESRQKEQVVMDILAEVYCHTLTVELTAKTMQVSHLEPEVLLASLQQEGIKLTNPNKVNMTKDAKTRKEQLYGHIQTLFRLQDLSPEYQYTLLNLLLMPEQGIETEVFHHWMDRTDYNSVNELVEYGWVQGDIPRNRIALHPFLHEVIYSFQKPSFQRCGKLITGIYLNCICYGLDVPYYNDLLNTLETIFRYIEMDDNTTAVKFINGALAYLDKYKRLETMERILTIMEENIPMDEEHRWERAVYLCFQGGLLGDSGNFLQAVQYFKEGITALGTICSEYAELASNLCHNISHMYLCMGEVAPSWEYAQKSKRIRESYYLKFNQDAITQTIHYALLLTIMGKSQKAMKLLLPLEREYKNQPYMWTTLAEVYKGLATVLAHSSPLLSRNYYKKAKECYLEHLPPEDE